MNKLTKAVLFTVLTFAVYIGGSQISANNDVFASAMARCCNNGICNEAPCSVGSSILPCSGSEYTTNCGACMDVVYQLYYCGKYLGPLPTHCHIGEIEYPAVDDWN